MTKSNRTLRANPFLTYRDPQTGQWVTILPKSEQNHPQSRKRPPQVLCLVEPEDYQHMELTFA